MPGNPTISVIIPVHNAEAYLRQCLDSVTGQTLRDIEIICVNDGSTDRSSEILREYARKDRRIAVIDQQNAGGGAARNRGLEISRGDYLSFLDADDFFKRDMLEKMHGRALETDSDIVICNHTTFNHKTRKYGTSGSTGRRYLSENDPFSYKDMPRYIFNAFLNAPWNKLYRRSLLAANALRFQEIRRTNDLLFSCSSLVLAKRMTVIDESLVFYRIGTQTSSQATNDTAPSDFYKALCALKATLIEMSVLEEVEQSFVNWSLSVCLHNLASLKTRKARLMLHRLLRTEYFKELGIEGHPHDFFYNRMQYYIYRTIERYPYRLYATTAVLSTPVSQFCDVYGKEGLKIALGKAVDRLRRDVPAART